MLTLVILSTCLLNLSLAEQKQRIRVKNQPNQADQAISMNFGMASNLTDFIKTTAIPAANLSSKRHQHRKRINLVEWGRFKYWDDCHFQPPTYWIVCYCILTPILAVMGLIGNWICLLVIIRKFSDEIAFLYQILIIISDSLAIIFFFLNTVIKRWGYGIGSGFHYRGCTLIPHTQTSYVAAAFHMYGPSALTDWLVSLTPLLLLATAVDRLLGMAKPLYYKHRFPQKKFLISMALCSVFLSSVSAIKREMGKIERFGPVTSLNGQEVYLYGRLVDSQALNPATRTFMAVVKTTTLVCLVVISICVLRFYRKTNTHQTQPSTVTTPQLLTKLISIQLAVVSIGVLPFVFQQMLFYVNRPLQLKYITELFIIRDMGYMFQVTANVYCYSAVCKRFRGAVREIVCCRGTQVAPSSSSHDAIDLSAINSFATRSIVPT